MNGATTHYTTSPPMREPVEVMQGRPPLQEMFPDLRARTCLDMSSAVVRLPLPREITVLSKMERPSSWLREKIDNAWAELPVRIADSMDRYFRENLTAANVLITVGVREGLRRMIDNQTTFDRGVVTMTPCYPGYHEVFAEKGIATTSVPLRISEDRHQVSIKEVAAILSPPRCNGKRVRGPGAIIVTTPNTPTNSFPVDNNLKQLNALCSELTTTLVADNTFDTFELTDRWTPPQLSLRSSVLLGSISEAYSLTQVGVSIGYLIAPNPVINVLRAAEPRLDSREAANRKMAAACAYLAMFELDGYLDERNAELRRRHAYAENQLKNSGISGLVSISGQAGTTKWLTFESAESADRVYRRLATHGIQIKHGADYGTPHALRLSLVAQTFEAEFHMAMKRVRDALR